MLKVALFKSDLQIEKNENSLCLCSPPFSLSSSSVGVLSGLTPSTRYTVTVSACSPIGCSESLRNDNGDDNDLGSSLTTPEEGKAGKHKPTCINTHVCIHTPINRSSFCLLTATLIYDRFFTWIHTDTCLNTLRRSLNTLLLSRQ